MPVRYKSVGRALRRGHLRIGHKLVPGGFEPDPLNMGIMKPKLIPVPIIERRTNKGRWVPYF